MSPVRQTQWWRRWSAAHDRVHVAAECGLSEILGCVFTFVPWLSISSRGRKKACMAAILKNSEITKLTPNDDRRLTDTFHLYRPV